MDCFGVYSFFSINSDKCRSCPQLQKCMMTCYGELKELSAIGNLKEVLQRHIKLMKKMKVPGAEDIESGRQAVSRQVTELSRLLTDLGMIKPGWVGKDIPQAPDFFQVAVDFLYRIKETTDEKLVRYIKDRAAKDMIGPNPDEAVVAMAAVSVQVLSKFKIIKVTGHKITWISTNSESES